MPRCRTLAASALLLLTLIFAAPAAPARDMGAATLPDTLKAGANTLVLNGAAFRKKYFIKIYACGLYLLKKDSNPDRIIAADEPMAVRMHFVYHRVDKKDMAEMLLTGFERSTRGNTAPIKENIDHLLSLLPAVLKKNDIVDLFYYPGRGMVCNINGKYAGESPGLVFKRAVFGIWLCDRPVSEELKKGLLGL